MTKNTIEKLLLVGLTVLLLFASVFYKYVSVKADKYKNLTPSSEKIRGSVDSVYGGSDSLYVSGWVLKEGVDSSPYYVKVILYDLSKEVGYGRRAQMSSREDITEYVSDGYNHDNSGFAVVFDKKTNVPKGNYEIVLQLRVDTEDYYLFTGEKVEMK